MAAKNFHCPIRARVVIRNNRIDVLAEAPEMRASGHGDGDSGLDVLGGQVLLEQLEQRRAQIVGRPVRVSVAAEEPGL